MASTPFEQITRRQMAVQAATVDLWNEVDRLIDENEITVDEAAVMVGLSRATLYRRLAEHCTTADWPSTPPEADCQRCGRPLDGEWYTMDDGEVRCSPCSLDHDL